MDIKVVKVPAMRFASFRAVGGSPEREAFAKLKAWAEPKGLWRRPGRRLFGFDNPAPMRGSPEYGYEVWLQVDDGYGEEGVRFVDFPGGDYAVARVEVPKGIGDAIGQGWGRLMHWASRSGYKADHTFCLEESIPTDRRDLEFILDLHLKVSR